MDFEELLSEIDNFIKCAKLDVKKTYGPYNRSSNPKDKRQIVIVVRNDGSKRTVSLPKFIMEQHLDRELDIDETVDHKNYDVRDNDINNLSVIDRAEHSALDTRRVKNIKITCSMCSKEFERSPRILRDKAKKGKPSSFCSRQCAGKYSRKVQLGQMDKLPAQDFVPSEYYRKKTEKSAKMMLAESFIEKYSDLF